MKKYFLGLTAIVFAIAFSAFTKPFAMEEYKLLSEPVVADIVDNPAQWSTSNSAQIFGRCDVLQNDIACTISLQSTLAAYFHEDASEDKVLNTFDYANGQNPKQDYLEIVETTSGVGNNRIISSITPKHYNTSTSQYETVSLGTNLTFKNARD